MALVWDNNKFRDLGDSLWQTNFDFSPFSRSFNVPLKTTKSSHGQAQRPKLNFLFDEEIFRERSARQRDVRNKSGKQPSNLPPGFPSRVEGARDWTGREYQDEATYAVVLNSVELQEVERALKVFQALNEDGDPGQVCPDNFPLPTLGPRLRAMVSTIFNGRGFVLIRGLEPARYSSTENIVIFNGITGYLAATRGCQDDFGNMIVHMRDMRSEISSPLRPTYTQDALPFHNDAAEVIAMYGQHAAREGGDTTFASCASIYNELATTRPDVLRTMAEGNWHYPEASEPTGYRARPLLFPSPQGPYWFFSRRRLTGLPETDLPTAAGARALPPMSEEQAEALDVFELTARKHSFAVRLRAGDVFVFHNLAMVHGRTAFRDGAGAGAGSAETGAGAPSTGQGRHIMRTFLFDADWSWRPKELSEVWAGIYARPEREVWSAAGEVEVKHILSDGDKCV